jgi:hypothetical protein
VVENGLKGSDTVSGAGVLRLRSAAPQFAQDDGSKGLSFEFQVKLSGCSCVTGYHRREQLFNAEIAETDSSVGEEKTLTAEGAKNSRKDRKDRQKRLPRWARRNTEDIGDPTRML